MKKVIFVCLLTLSVCFSQPAEQPSPAPTKPAPVNVAEPKPTDGLTKPQASQGGAPNPAAETTGQSAASNPAPNPAPNPATNPASNPASTTASSPASSQATPKPSPTQPSTAATPPGDNKPTTLAPPTEASTKNASNETVTPSPTIAPSNNSANTDDHKPTSEAPAPKPESSTPKTVVQARGFDGASFVGGIILTLGLIAIGFMGLKYYRAQTERNYHTL